MMFQSGDTVIHPYHGTAVVAGVEQRTINGESVPYVTLYVEAERMRIITPQNRMHRDLRKVSTKTDAIQALQVLTEPVPPVTSSWAKWYKQLCDKLQSGDLQQIVEVVRDVTCQRNNKDGTSPSAKRKLTEAKMLMLTEMLLAFKPDLEATIQRLDTILPLPE